MSSDATRKPIAVLTCDERVDTSEDAIDWDQVDAIVQSELASARPRGWSGAGIDSRPQRVKPREKLAAI